MKRYVDADALIKDIPNTRVDIFENCRNCSTLLRDEVIEIIDAQPTADVREVMNSAWIPVTTRPMDSEEREYWSDHFGYPLDDEDAVIFNCKMPEDGQKILVSFSTFVLTDTCEIDGGCYGLEENGDWVGITAWMPMPKPYRGDA